MPSYSLKPGGLLAKTLPSRSFRGMKSPNWCTHLRNPVVHRMRLLWRPRFIYNSQENEGKDVYVDECEDEGESECENQNDYKEETFLKSPSFTLKESWLKGNLVTLATPRRPYNVYLEMAPGLEKRVQGRVQKAYSTTSNQDNPALRVRKARGVVLLSPGTYRDRWNLGPYPDYYHDMIHPFAPNIIHLLIDFVILNDASTDLACCQTKLFKDIATLLADKDTADITLKTGTTELRAHKFFLGMRSPVLKAMLSADMVEGRTGVIELKEMSAAATEAFLNFIYTAKINKKKLTETAEELLGAASMYDMPDLKGVCETALRQMITVDNTARFLLLAHLHDAALLKSATLDFFLNNKDAVIDTEEWKVLITENMKIFLDEILNVI